MTIFDYSDSLDKNKWTEQIRSCEWRAASFLADLLETGRFHELLGDGSLFILVDEENLVSFCTLTQKDCIDDESLFPWIGFVFTAPEYRGHRHSGELIDFVCNKAERSGYEKVYLATDHIGLYEKYGFEYAENRTDIYGEESRIYFKDMAYQPFTG